MFLKAIVGIACIAYGCITLASGASGGTLLMGIAALILGGAIILSAARGPGGRHR